MVIRALHNAHSYHYVLTRGQYLDKLFAVLTRRGHIRQVITTDVKTRRTKENTPRNNRQGRVWTLVAFASLCSELHREWWGSVFVISHDQCLWSLVPLRRDTVVDGGGGGGIAYHTMVIFWGTAYRTMASRLYMHRPTSIFMQQGGLNFRWFEWRSSHILCMRGLNIRGFNRTPRTPPAYGPALHAPVQGLTDCIELAGLWDYMWPQFNRRQFSRV